MNDTVVQLVNVGKYFDGKNNKALTNITIDIKRGEFLTLLGPSGCGKTTTLRIIAGFENPSCGKVFIDNEDVSDIPPYRRNINTVFQNYALFPNMNIYDNIAFGLTMKKVPKDEIKVKVDKMLKMIQLEGYENRMPDKLSGGQKQRVAIARAIVNNPKVLLLDEPLAALDLKLRKQMQVELKHLQRQLGITFVYVTHDQEEALTMSDRIAVMNKGYFEQIGSPDEIYERPKTKFVSNFIGESNLFEGQIAKSNSHETLVEIGDDKKIKVDASKLDVGDKVYIAVRPEKLKFRSHPQEEEDFLKVKFKERIYVGAILKTIVVLENGKEITVNEPSGDFFNFDGSKKEAFVTWNPKNSVVIKS